MEHGLECGDWCEVCEVSFVGLCRVMVRLWSFALQLPPNCLAFAEGLKFLGVDVEGEWKLVITLVWEVFS